MHSIRKYISLSTLTAIQWTAWRAAALATNVAMGALPGAIIGMVCGYAHAEWNAPRKKKIRLRFESVL
jgi:hypothetical protein